MRSRMIALTVILASLLIGQAALAKDRVVTRTADGKTRLYTIWETAKKDSALGLTKFAKWIDKSGMDHRLDDKKAVYTVFAPNNAAINTLSSQDSAWFWSKNDTAMSNAAKYCVLSGKRLTLSDLMKMNGQSLTMDNGLQLPVMVNNGKVMVGNASIVDPDHPALNGVIHVVDAVLLINKMVPMTTSSPTSNQVKEPNAPMSAPTPMGTMPYDSMRMDSANRGEPTPRTK